MPETTAPKKNWGRWGADDERGALNLIDDTKRASDYEVLRTGKIYSLGLPIQRSGVPVFEYRGPAQRLTLASQTDGAFWESFGEAMDIPTDGAGGNEDLLIFGTHSGTHLDALCHVYHDDHMYNGFETSTFGSYGGAARNSIHQVDGVAGRAVMLDVAAHLGVPWLDPMFRITDDVLEEVREAQGTSIRPGDILLVRTGWIDSFYDSLANGTELSAAQAGIDQSAVDFIDRYDIALVGSDNGAVECLPCDETLLSVHVKLLVHRGINLLEFADLRGMAADGVHECFLVIAPMKVVGGTGSPVNPIAIA
ncbi:cyclase family protein [Microbacterium sp. LWH7-1.2]|uniref:cyclase family protein n=1 Tax=Microbacterium sp. LWH7-1.2 TaxID=3135257 RepID=UPI00313A14BB